MSDREVLDAARCKLDEQRRAVRLPTLQEIQRWPATVDVPTAAQAFGLKRSTAYELAKRDRFPARIIKAGARYRVVTASIVRALSEEENVA